MSLRTPLVGIPTCFREVNERVMYTAVVRYPHAVVDAAGCLPMLIPSIGDKLDIDALRAASTDMRTQRNRIGELVSDAITETIIEHLTQKLGIEVGETTPDGRVTLLSVECLCACEMAPMMQVDDRYELNLTAEKVDRILGALS